MTSLDTGALAAWLDDQARQHLFSGVALVTEKGGTLFEHAAGLGVRAPEREHAAGVMMMPIPRSGVLRSVRGLERARAVPGIEGVEVVIRPGEAIRALPEGTSYLGFLFARADTPDGVEAALRAAHTEIELDLAPLLT